MFRIISSFLLSISVLHAYDFTNFNEVDLWQSASKPLFKFYFKVNGDVATMGATIEVSGNKWFSVGVTSSGGMIGSDMAIFTPDANKDYNIADYWSMNFSKPKLDQKQDLTLIHSATTGGLTTVVWQRNHKSCDQDEDLDLLDHPNVIFAIGRSGDLSYHEHRGNAVVDWLTGDVTKLKEAAMEKDAISFDMRPPTPIRLYRDKKTQYHCVSLPLNISEDHHLIKLEPLVDTKYAHHMVYFYCNDEVLTYQGKKVPHYQNIDCSLMAPAGCQSGGGWAVGGKTKYYDSKFGVLVSKKVKSFFIQYHYDNYDYSQDIVDRTGVKLFFTPTLRKNNLARVGIGIPAQPFGAAQVSEIRLPAGKKNVLLESQLASECSKKMTIESSKIVGVGFHMHQLGTYSYMEHWREGKRLPDIGWQHWDFNFQTAQSFPPERWVDFRRGDSLRLHCQFDTTSATNITYGGDGSDNEMCLAFVEMFPSPGVGTAMTLDNTLATTPFKGKNLCLHGSAGSASGSDALNNLNGSKTMLQWIVNKDDFPAPQGRMKEPRVCEKSSPPKDPTPPDSEVSPEPVKDAGTQSRQMDIYGVSLMVILGAGLANMN